MNGQTLPPQLIAKLYEVSHYYHRLPALDNIKLEIPSGCIVGFIGPDGVGKSSLLGLISGVKRIQTGKVEVLGGDMSSTFHRRTVCPRIAYMPQGLGKNLYPTLSVFENLDFFGRLFDKSSKERKLRIEELLNRTGLAPFSSRPVANLSGGMKQKLGLCCALIHDPDLLILDEPTTGVDPLSRRQFWELINRIRAKLKGISIIVATAYMEEAEKLDWLVAMDAGKVLATGKPEELKSRIGTSDLEEAFISLLPEEKRSAHKKLSIKTPMCFTGKIAIEARGLTKRFGNFTAVDNVSFQIKKGEIFGFVGSNGCGKTTTMKMLTGLLSPSEGKAWLFGNLVNPKDIETRKRLGYMSQSFSLYSELTVIQNLELHARLFHLPDDQIYSRIDELASRMGLIEVLDEQAEKLPLGIRQRLSLAVAVIHYPELLILDEPTSGVDPVARDKFWELLIDLSRNKGVTIFISTHFMNEAERCDRISLMHAGKVLASDAPYIITRSREASSLEDAFISHIEEASHDQFNASSYKQNKETANIKHQFQNPRLQINGLLNINRFWAFAHRESMEIIRDPVRLLFALFGPLMLMVVLVYGISFDVENLPYAALDHDQTVESREYLENYSGSRYFEERTPIKNYLELENRLKSGELRLAIEIPPTFGKDLKRGNQPEIGIWIDGALPFRAETARGYIFGLHELYLDNVRQYTQWEKYEEIPFNIETRFRYNQEMKSVFAIAPGLIVLFLALIPAILTAVGVVREKELGSITNLYATPANRLEFLVGKQAPYVIIGMINFFSLVFMTIFLFGVPLKGSFLALMLGALLYVISTTGFGLLISAFTKTQIAALFAALLITWTTSMDFSGFLEPLSSLTGGALLIGQTFPAAYFMKISVGTFTKALRFNDLSINYAAIGILMIIYLMLSLIFLKKQES